MRAVRLRAIGAPLVDARIPTPVCRPGEILVRVTAAGICRSDLHYRSGTSSTGKLPQTLGHEIAGVVARDGGASDAGPHSATGAIRIGTRVCIHYLVSCGSCDQCVAGNEQFCSSGVMIGKHRDGGFAEYVVVPERNVLPLPDAVSDEAAAVMMCSTATALHALRKADLRGGESVAVFGVGGLGMSAVQLASLLGARAVYAVDISPERLEAAASFGAVAIDARSTDPVGAIREATNGRGVDVAVELLGLTATVQQAVAALAPLGRAAVAGITEAPVPLEVYRDLVGREAELIGVSDHTRGEIELLLAFAAAGRLRFEGIVTKRLPLEAAAINDALDNLARFGAGVRAVVNPTGGGV